MDNEVKMTWKDIIEYVNQTDYNKQFILVVNVEATNE